MKKIGLLGLAFGSTNKGCEALGYGFLNVLEKVAVETKNEFEILIFERCDVNLIHKNGDYKHLHLKSIPIPGISSISNINTHRKNFRICNYIFDLELFFGRSNYSQMSVDALAVSRSIFP